MHYHTNGVRESFQTSHFMPQGSHGSALQVCMGLCASVQSIPSCSLPKALSQST